MNRTRKIGILQVTLSGICFGVLGPLGKSLFQSGVTSGEMLGFRFLLAAVILWLYVLLRMPGKWKLPLRTIFICGALGTLGYALFSFIFFQALRGLSVSLAVLLLYTYPIIVAAAGWVIWDERIPERKWIALPLVVAGLALLLWGELTIGNFGSFLLGLASAFLYSAYILASSRALKGVHPIVSLTYILTFAGIALSLIHLRDVSRDLLIVRENWTALSGIVLLGTVAAMALFLAGLQKLRPWEVALLSTSEPVTGIFLASIFFAEHLSAQQIVGALGVLGGLVVVSLPDQPVLIANRTVPGG